MKTNDTKINDAVRDHEISTEWVYQQLAGELHRWFDIFNGDLFEDTLLTPFLQFARTRRSNLGHYRPGHNGVGARHEINMNKLHMHDRPFSEMLGTLLHEMVHEWQELFGQPGKGGYHNKQFAAKCAALGIPCTGGYRSYSTGYTDPFIALLQRHGVDMEMRLPLTALPEKNGGSKLKKWSCGCTNIRVAVEVQALCLKCGGFFQRAD